MTAYHLLALQPASLPPTQQLHQSSFKASVTFFVSPTLLFHPHKVHCNITKKYFILIIYSITFSNFLMSSQFICSSPLIGLSLENSIKQPSTCRQVACRSSEMESSQIFTPSFWGLPSARENIFERVEGFIFLIFMVLFFDPSSLFILRILLRIVE